MIIQGKWSLPRTRHQRNLLKKPLLAVEHGENAPASMRSVFEKQIFLEFARRRFPRFP